MAYAYYVNADSHGEDNDLKLVTVTMPLTDSGINSVRKTGYWYYEGSYDANNNPGYVHQIEYVISSEGYRKFDRLDSTDDDDPLTATEADLSPYASAFFKYNTDRQAKSAWFNGAWLLAPPGFPERVKSCLRRDDERPRVSCRCGEIETRHQARIPAWRFRLLSKPSMKLPRQISGRAIELTQ